MSSTRSTLGFFARVKQTTSYILHSEPVIKATSAIDGAVNSAFGIYTMIDLAFQWVPSLYFNALSITKYTITGMSFVISTAHAYRKDHNALHDAEKVDILKDNFAKCTRLIAESNLLFAGFATHAKIIGYGSHHQHDIILEITDVKPEQSAAEQCTSRPREGIKALFSGLLTAAGIYYIFDLAETFISHSKELELTRNIIMGLSTCIKTLKAYDKNQLSLQTRMAINDLLLKIDPMQEKLTQIKNKLGNREKLLSLIQQIGKMTQQSIPLNIVLFSPDTPPSLYTRIYSSNPFLWLRSLVNGGILAGGVRCLLEIAFPEWVVLRYSAAVLALIAGSVYAHADKQADIEFHEKINRFIIKFNEVMELVILANKILLLEHEHLQNLLADTTHSQEENILDEASADEILNTDLDLLMDTLNPEPIHTVNSVSTTGFFAHKESRKSNSSEPLLGTQMSSLSGQI